uniref:Cytochrome c oxidase subunit 3 n=1 Tax=Macrocentrus camphoraphilus TaxID=684659 RepID=D8WHD0_9HYME|nr:cytochrome c oxidase subunit III [Macrocentrus camphoraphilus]
MKMMNFYFPFHLVSMSPWPLMMSLNLLLFFLMVLKFFFEFNNIMLIIVLINLLLIMYQWWRDVIRESTFQGDHSNKVYSMLRLGMFMFILSEIMFFLSFFWCYFHMYLSPSLEIGLNWPPMIINVFNPYNIPLLNTILLLSSGVTITWCHFSILNKFKLDAFFSIFLTLFLGILFTFYQYKEYKESYFCINDSVYGSIFFMSTGFHGMHVLIGTLFIMICFYRLMKNQFSLIHHLGFEMSSWYWHFVDIVWLFLYLFVYWICY